MKTPAMITCPSCGEKTPYWNERQKSVQIGCPWIGCGASTDVIFKNKKYFRKFLAKMKRSKK